MAKKSELKAAVKHGMLDGCLCGATLDAGQIGIMNLNDELCDHEADGDGLFQCNATNANAKAVWCFRYVCDSYPIA